MEIKELKVEERMDDLCAEKLTHIENITDENIEMSLNYDALSPAEKKAIDKFNKEIDITDSTQVLQYGVASQKKISEFSDSILSDVKTKDIGNTGDMLADLVSEIRTFDKGIVSKSNSFIKRLFTNAKKEAMRIRAKYSKIENNIEDISSNLEKDKVRLLKDISIFDTMYERNLEYFKELSLYVIAGDRKIKELREVELPKLREAAEKSKDQMDAQKVQDMENMINRFEKKIYDLKTTRIISIQMAPQIRMLQNNESELVEKIQSSLTNTIPLWKNQMVLALGITNAKAALKSEKAVTDLTNKMLKDNSEALKQGSIDIARESERAIVDIDTLILTNRNLIQTFDEIIEIQNEGKSRRETAEKELSMLEKELKDKMLEIKVDKEG